MDLSQNYYEYVKLLFQLHQLMVADEDDERGDKIREKMDFYWYKMTEQEVNLSSEISSLLYFVDKDEVYQKFIPDYIWDYAKKQIKEW